jgi:hypothetical protein
MRVVTRKGLSYEAQTKPQLCKSRYTLLVVETGQHRWDKTFNSSPESEKS